MRSWQQVASSTWHWASGWDDRRSTQTRRRDSSLMLICSSVLSTIHHNTPAVQMPWQTLALRQHFTHYRPKCSTTQTDTLLATTHAQTMPSSIPPATRTSITARTQVRHVVKVSLLLNNLPGFTCPATAKSHPPSMRRWVTPWEQNKSRQSANPDNPRVNSTALHSKI